MLSRRGMEATALVDTTLQTDPVPSSSHSEQASSTRVQVKFQYNFALFHTTDDMGKWLRTVH